MAGYPSNLAKKFSPTEQFPQHILPLLPLYNAQWWGYESLTAIVLVDFNLIESQVWNEYFWFRNSHVFFTAVTIICIGTAWWPYRYVSLDFCIDSSPLVTLLSQPYWGRLISLFRHLCAACRCLRCLGQWRRPGTACASTMQTTSRERDCTWAWRSSVLRVRRPLHDTSSWRTWRGNTGLACSILKVVVEFWSIQSNLIGHYIK